MKEGTRRRHHEERPSDGDGEKGENPQRGRGVHVLGPCGEGEREGDDGEDEDDEVDSRLAAKSECPDGEVGVCVSGEESRLEKHHRSVPHGGRAAENREDHLRHHRLDEEDEARPEANSRPENKKHHPVGDAAAFLADLIRFPPFDDAQNTLRKTLREDT